MDAADRIIEEFERVSKTERDQVSSLSFADQVVYLVVFARCEKDIGGFESVFEQGLNNAELSVLITGLRRMNEPELADQFARVLELLEHSDFYTRHRRNYEKLPKKAKEEIATIAEIIEDRLWDLDEKLVELLETPP